MGFLSDLGGSQAGTSLSNYLMQRRQEKRMDAGQARQAEFQGAQIQQMGQRMKMNEQLMQQREMQNNTMQTQMEDAEKERKRRGQVGKWTDFLESIPAGANSQPAQMWTQLAKQRGVIRADGRYNYGMLEDFRKEVASDPKMSSMIASSNVNHYENQVAQFKQMLATEKYPDGMKEEDVRAQLQEAEKQKHMTIQADEGLRKVNQKRTEVNHAAFQDMAKNNKGLGPMLLSAFGGIPNMYGMKGNPNSPDSRKFKQVWGEYQADKARREALDRRAKRESGGKPTIFEKIFADSKRRNPEKFGNMSMLEYRKNHYPTEGGKISEQFALQLITDAAGHDPEKVPAVTKRYKELVKETGANRLDAVTQVKKELTTLPTNQELVVALKDAKVQDPHGKEAVDFMVNNYPHLTRKKAKEYLQKAIKK